MAIKSSIFPIPLFCKSCDPKKPLKAVDVNMNKMPDVAMILAVVALFADGPTAIRDGKLSMAFHTSLVENRALVQAGLAH